ncbi:glycosyltransferase family 92 protein [Actibacterium sp. XHP0104]|uniref:glycosyltransferase family 92 protein n=1 Tax=Actibacterium sp. XHP0104 TaxID=2984335 RepID=UPI0021E8C791|nr:glycosyltransferase family 92 protein [Actibacterium sp. XHP0104]MCV2881943.1 glycosyltransferase family 92 protein [Actibacterium sp. XHP0104]
MFSFLRRTKSISRIALDPPVPAPGRAGLAVVLIVRNEERHIAEWTRFHRAAGVAHFYVYDNGSTDQTVSRLIDAAGAGAVTVMPWDQKLRDGVNGAEIHNQVLAYAHAVRNFGGGYRWMTFIDVDEFLVPRSGKTLPECLGHLGQEVNISLPWHMFGRNGFEDAPEGGIVPNYTRRHPDPMSPLKGMCNFKMIVDPCHVTAIKVHSIETDGSTDSVNDRGQRAAAADRAKPGFYSADHIQLNHYYTRSNSELQAKINRGSNMTQNQADHLRRVMRKVDQIEAQSVEDLAAKQWFAGHEQP